MTAALLLVLLAYVAGSAPCGYLLGKYLWRVDIRTQGSRNTGATNLARVVGKPWGPLAFALAFLLDFGKGFLAVWLANTAARSGWVLPRAASWLAVGAGVAVIVGHNWTMFLGFKGGKGVATSLGVLACLAPREAGLALLAFLLCFGATRIVSLSSIVAAVVLPLAAVYLRLRGPVLLFVALAGILIIVRHRANIGRLLHGTEKKVF
ncbi:MAG TPA: glycerol-3-phosphate 1-O-acyltransferase PlsY [bacterium]|nr:glycerol-3-phosphate 1-O-acyltransferase PlsY [bacterium]